LPFADGQLGWPREDDAGSLTEPYHPAACGAPFFRSFLSRSWWGAGSDSDTTTTGIPAEATPSVAKPAKSVVVHEAEFKFDPARADGGDEGLVTIKVVNDGAVAHALAVDGP